MRKILFLCTMFCIFINSHAQQCRFEKTNGLESATYFEAIDWYKNLDKKSPQVYVKEMGMTDAGYPLHLVLISNDAKFDPVLWHKQNKVVILINNGIHAGEPDGIDASMLLVRDIIQHKIILPDNVALGVIPVYNIGGCLNRSGYSRVNQNGPKEYGFRGSAQNLDLNRDFTKCDSKEAKVFVQIFQMMDPDILVDNHVSDGADYQHTMTLLTSQYDKLGSGLGAWVRDHFEPQLYQSMSEKKWDMVPYVDFAANDVNKGLVIFYDPPRFSSGYAALFQTIGFVPETHMLKPFKDRVLATYAFMQTLIDKSAANAEALHKERVQAKAEMLKQKEWPLNWTLDTSRSTTVNFKGYEKGYKTSEATGMQRMFYDRSKPFTKQVPFYNTFNQANTVAVPKAYIIPHGWNAVVDLMKLNHVTVKEIAHDTFINVVTYHIKDYKSTSRPNEKHHKNSNVEISTTTQSIRFLKGDYFIETAQPAKRYIIEMLEPTGDDSFFAWNFFDAILQQKEGYSDYRWEDVAGDLIKNNPELKAKLDEKKKQDEKFAASSASQLEFIYKNSPYYEPVHNRYPVFKLME